METCNLFKAYIHTTSYSFKKGFPIYITTHFHRFYPTSLKNYELELSLQVDWVAEWLRRWTANPMGSARVGSNPILVVNFIFTPKVCVFFFFFFLCVQDRF